jgi:hypothetical protein
MKRLIAMLPVFAAAGVLLLESGCASTDSVDKGSDFSQYHSFAVLPLPDRGTYQDPAIVTRLGSTVKQSVADTLSAKGYEEVKESEADLLVNLLFDYRPEEGRRELRTLQIQLLDAKSRGVVWSRYTQRVTDSTMPPKAASQAVVDLLKTVPSASKRLTP